MKILRDLFEGLHTKDGKIHYNDDPHHKDESHFKTFTHTHDKGHSSSLPFYSMGTPEEEHDLRRHLKSNPGVYQKDLPVFYGMPMQKVGTDDPDAKDHFENFKYALKGKKTMGKGKNAKTVTPFDPASAAKLVNKGASNVIHQMAKELDMKSYDNIIIMPLPSSSNLSKRFGQALKHAADVVGNDVFLSHGTIQKSNNPKISPIKKDAAFSSGNVSKERLERSGRGSSRKIPEFEKHSKISENTMDDKDLKKTRYHWEPIKKGTPPEKDYGQVYDSVIFSEKNMKMKGEDAIRNWLEKRRDSLPQKIEKLNNDIEEASGRDKTSMLYLRKAYKDELERWPAITKRFEHKLKLYKKKGWNGKPDPNTKSFKISEIGGGSYRHHVYDNMEVGDIDDELFDKITDEDSKTLIILSDDNVDTNKTMNDVYKKMFKDGYIHKNTKVVAAALHNLNANAISQAAGGKGGGKAKPAVPVQSSFKSPAEAKKAVAQKVNDLMSSGGLSANHINSYIHQQNKIRMNTNRKHNLNLPMLNGFPAVLDLLANNASTISSKGVDKETAVNQAIQALSGTNESVTFIGFLIAD